MEGLLDLLKKIQFNPTPASLGLLNMGAQMLNNSTNQRQPVGFGNVLGSGLQGMTEGMMAGQQFRNSSADSQYRQQLLNSKLAEMETQKKREEDLSQLDLTQAPDQIAKQLAGLGMTKEALDLIKPKREGIPTGWDAGDKEGMIKSKMIDLGNGQTMPYADYQMALWSQKQNTPGYGEPQRLQMAQEDQGMQRQQLGISMQNADLARERLAMDKEAKQRSLIKDVPAPQQSAYIGNVSSIQKIDDAIRAIESNPDAIGPTKAFGEFVNQNLDPEGVDARSRIAEVGATKIHDLSGAAVTAAEAPRLKPFVPLVTDNPRAALTKLKNLKKALEDNNGQITNFYSPDKGYRDLFGNQQQSFDITVPDDIKGDPQKEADYVDQQLTQPKRRATDKPNRLDELRKKHGL